MTTTRADALLRLGITDEQLAHAPQVSPDLRMIAKTIQGRTPGPYGPGSDIYHAWPAYLAASDDPEAVRVRNVYHAIPNYLRRALPVEAYCLAAGVAPHRILEILTACVLRLGAQASSIIAAVNHPRVVAKTIDVALTDDGVKDREMLHKHANFLPTPAGAKTSIVVTQNATANAQAAAVAPPPEQTIRRLADRFNLARTLPERVTEPVPILPVADAELVELAELAEPDDDVRED